MALELLSTFDYPTHLPDHGASAAQQLLLDAWASQTAAESLLTGEGRLALCARLNGISLFAGPVTVMARPAPLMPLEPTPGVCWVLVNARGYWVKSFAGEPDGKLNTGTFEDFAGRISNFEEADWLHHAGVLNA